jgi:hypothetical protein
MQDLLEAATVLGEGGGSEALEDHEAAANPHPTYETSAEAQAKVDAAVAALVNSAPATLNTLKELSDALGADASYAATITTALGDKQPLDSDLTAIAALTTTSYGRSLLALADAATLRLSAGLGPELTPFGAAGTPIDFTAPSLDTGVTDGAVAGYARRLVFPANTATFADVASAIGTGNFDLRARIGHVGPLVAIGSTLFTSLMFYVADSNREATTKLAVKLYGESPAAGPYFSSQVGTAEAGAVVRPPKFPCWARMTRVGTAVTFYVSFTEEASWVQLHTATSALNIAKVGFIGTSGVALMTMEALIHQVKSI